MNEGGINLFENNYFLYVKKYKQHVIVIWEDCKFYKPLWFIPRLSHVDRIRYCSLTKEVIFDNITLLWNKQLIAKEITMVDSEFDRLFEPFVGDWAGP